MSPRVLAAVAAALLVLLPLGWWLLRSDEDRIRAVMAEAEAAVEERNPQGVMDTLTQDFTAPRGVTRDSLHDALNRWLFTYQVDVELTPNPLEVHLNPDHDDEATVTFHVRARVRQRNDEPWTEWQSTRELQRGLIATFRRTDEGWRIRRVDAP
ncbi:MAG: nuclear transport factor 2 family protein [Myxococcota bacterium]